MINFRSLLNTNLTIGLAVVLILGTCFSCGSEEKEVATSSPDVGNHRAGAQMMKDSIAAIVASLDFSNHPYESARRLKIIEQQVQLAQKQNKLSPHLLLGYAMTLLNAGESQRAIEIFESILEQLPQNKVINETTHGLHEGLALAYMRRGEQQNCIANHTPSSCIFPIQPEAQHVLPESSQKAIEIYEQILAVFPNDLRSRWLLNIAYQTLGRYPQDVPKQWLMDPALFEPEANLPRFKNIAAEIGVDVYDLAGGTVLDDFNGDGYLDMLSSSWDLDGTLRYFLNDKKGAFNDQTAAAGLDAVVGGLNIIQADYDNDGDLDFYILRGAWSGTENLGQLPNSLVRNNGDGTFSDVTIAGGLYAAEPSQAAVWLDYNLDGWLDLYVTNETVTPNELHPCHLYLNQQDGTFKDVAPQLGLAVTGFIKGVAAADVNADGRPDLYLSYMDGPNRLYLNEGGSSPEQWNFREAGAAAGVTKPDSSFPTWFFDYDNDGDEDIFVVNFDNYLLKQQSHEMVADFLDLPLRTTYSRLYQNDGTGVFTDVTVNTGLDQVLPAMGCNFGDLDNDGFPDFYLGTGAPDFRAVVPNLMFKNDAGERFKNVTYAGGFGHIQKGHGISFADVNNDGDQDIYAVMGGSVSGDVFQNAFFENPGNDNHWLSLRLEGTSANRSAIGARIRLRVVDGNGERFIYHTVNSGGSFGANSLQAEIGLGASVDEVSLSVIWPDGNAKWVEYGSGPFDQIFQLKQGQQAPEKVNVPAYEFAQQSGEQHHHHHNH